MTQEQAISDLKKAKELLDLEIITQEEYDKIKADLLPSLRAGFDHPQHNIENKPISIPNTETAPTIDLEAEAMAAKIEDPEPVKKPETISSSDTAIIVVLVVVILFIIGVLATYFITNSSKKENTVHSKQVASVTTTESAPVATTKSAPVATSATEAEIAEAWSQWLKLYNELEKFKKKSDFHNYGLSSASPYQNWSKRVDDLAQTKGGKELPGRYEVSAYDLTQLAWQYISNKGKEDDYTKYIAGIVKKKTQKKVAESKPTEEVITNTQSSGQEVIIGQWRVSNRYVKDEFDVIIKKEGTKYYAYKAGNKKQVRKEGNKYYEIDNEWGEYYYVTSDGNMKFGDEDGLVSPEIGYIIVKK